MLTQTCWEVICVSWTLRSKVSECAERSRSSYEAIGTIVCVYGLVRNSITPIIFIMFVIQLKHLAKSCCIDSGGGKVINFIPKFGSEWLRRIMRSYITFKIRLWPIACCEFSPIIVIEQLKRGTWSTSSMRAKEVLGVILLGADIIFVCTPLWPMDVRVQGSWIVRALVQLK